MNEQMKERVPYQEIDYLALKDLRMDHYQRNTNQQRVKDMAADFDENRVMVLLVSYRDGQYFLIDGGHRRSTMLQLGYTHALCIVLRGLTYEREAYYFRMQDKNNQRPSHPEKFQAGIEEKDEQHVAINEIVRKYDFAIGRSKNSIQSIKELFNICEMYGVQTLDTVLQLIRETWDGATLALRRESLIGLAEFVHRFGRVEFVERMRQRDIYTIWRKFKELYANALGSTTAPARNAFCASLVHFYNKGLQRNSRRYLKMEG